MTARDLVAATALLALMPGGTAAQQKRPALTPAAYGQWESLGRALLSPDGRWLAYEVRRVDETAELRARPLDRDTVVVIAHGQEAAFSPDGRWLTWRVGLSEDERRRLEKAEEPIRLDAGLMELATGATRTFDDVESLAFDPSGRYLALKAYAPAEGPGKGADARVLELDSDVATAFGNVAELAWSDHGPLLALAISTGGKDGNGVQVFDAVRSTLRSLDASDRAYRALAWREGAADLAALRSAEPAADEGTEHEVLAWRRVDGDGPRRLVLDPAAAGVADSLEVVEHRRPEWSGDGRSLSFGLRPEAPEEDSASVPDSAASAEGEEEEDPAGVQIWHTSDVRIFPQQKATEQADARRSLLAVWHLDEGRVVRVGKDLRADAEVLEGWRHAVESTDAPYAWGAMFGRPYHDVWVIDLLSGERRRALERVRYTWEAPGGAYLLTFDGRDHWSYEVGSGKRRNLTAGLPAVFADTAYDTPTDVLPPHGVAGWSDGDRAVYLYDEFDVWRIRPDGSDAVRLTHGAEDEVVHRLVDLDREEEALDARGPLYLSLAGRWTKRQGYARLDPDDTVRRLVFTDRRVTGLQRADSAGVFLYRVGDFDDSPDWVVAGADLADPREVTRTNPFQQDFAWGRSELMDFTSESGRRLQAALLYPAGYEAGRRYPMIVYTYEILSPGVHDYVVPSERSYYNFSVWTQRGYFVLLPDIVYRARDPGVSALEAVRPAVARVVELGRADPERVGLIGHSWGGYQATYLPTRTDIFAASVAGAPLTDFVSMMGAIHWNPGIAELSHWETGQARMEVPFWEDPEAHRRNSPVHEVHRMETPLLMAFGDRDGVVDFDQGTEFFNFARRAGKRMVLLVYEGEDHGFRRKANQVDYHRRILEWFGHFLKDEPAPRWIEEGVPLGETEAEVRRVAAGKGG